MLLFIIILVFLIVDSSRATVSRFSRTVGGSKFEKCLILSAKTSVAGESDTLVQLFFNVDKDVNRFAIEVAEQEARGYVALSVNENLSLLATVDASTQLPTLWQTDSFNNILLGKKLATSTQYHIVASSIVNPAGLFSIEFEIQSSALPTATKPLWTTESNENMQVAIVSDYVLFKNIKNKNKKLDNL